MNLEFEGRVAPVTGASVGIGRGVAKALAAEGVRLATGLKVDVGERLARTLRADREMIEEDVRVLRHERGAEPFVGDLSGHLETPRGERREIGRNVGSWLCRRADRLAVAARQRQLVDATPVTDAAPDRPDRLGRSSARGTRCRKVRLRFLGSTHR